MAATELLEEALAAHGGVDRWRAAGTVRARVRAGGLLLRTRVPGNKFADYRLAVDVQGQAATMDPFPVPGRRGVFDHGRARIESDSGEVLESRDEPRTAFFGAAGLRRNLRWDALDSAYFGGYAMWNYMTTPYLLTRPGVEVRAAATWREDGAEWRRLRARFPTGLPTHSEEQTFYFDRDGLLRRHDYVARVVGRWARAAHYCADHAEAGGLVFPTRRWVRPIGLGNRSLPFPTMVALELAELEVETA